MTPETKAILKQSINEFLAYTDEERENKVSFIENKVKEHYTALNTIGVGYKESMVRAGEIFLRIYKH